jgi:hypothetical protein
MHHGVNNNKINHNKAPNTTILNLNIFLMDLASF